MCKLTIILNILAVQFKLLNMHNSIEEGQYGPNTTCANQQQTVSCILCMTQFNCDHGVEDLQNHLIMVHQCTVNVGFMLQMCLNTFQQNPQSGQSLIGYNNQSATSNIFWQQQYSLDSYGSSFNQDSSSFNSRRNRFSSESSDASDWSSLHSSLERPVSRLSNLDIRSVSQQSNHLLNIPGSNSQVSSPCSPTGTNSFDFNQVSFESPVLNQNVDYATSCRQHFSLHSVKSESCISDDIQTSTPTSSFEDKSAMKLFDTPSPFTSYLTEPQQPNLVKNPVPDDLKQKIITSNPNQSIEFIYSQRMNDQMVLNSYILKKKKGPIVKNNKRRMYWMCIAAGCPVRVTSMEGQLTYAFRGHNHLPEHADVLRRKHKAKLRGKICF